MASDKNKLQKPKDERICWGLFPGHAPTVEWSKAETEGSQKWFVKSYSTEELDTITGLARTLTGTVLDNKILWINQGVVILIVVVVMVLELTIAGQGWSDWMAANESKTRSFVQAMSKLVSFLLAFYVSISIGRWWSVRTSGVGAVVCATQQLTLYLSGFVTRDEQVLSAIRRYAATSLMSLYADRIQHQGKWDYIMKHCTLTDEEVRGLQQLGDPGLGCWAWIAKIVAVLEQKGLIKSPAQCQLLMEQCARGSAGYGVCKTYITQQLPMVYVQLLTLMVKSHNFFMCLVMGLIAGHYIRNFDVIFITSILRVFLTTFMFNAVLCIGGQLADPFGGDPTDFNVPLISEGVVTSNQQVAIATREFPQALLETVRDATAHV